jgi:hypothetical protein
MAGIVQPVSEVVPEGALRRESFLWSVAVRRLETGEFAHELLDLEVQFVIGPAQALDEKPACDLVPEHIHSRPVSLHRLVDVDRGEL